MKSCTAVLTLSFQQIDRSTVKIVLWFDNEFGFANRIVDLVKKSYEVSLDK